MKTIQQCYNDLDDASPCKCPVCGRPACYHRTGVYKRVKSPTVTVHCDDCYSWTEKQLIENGWLKLSTSGLAGLFGYVEHEEDENEVTMAVIREKLF
jgi:hypothetical protein